MTRETLLHKLIHLSFLLKTTEAIQQKTVMFGINELPKKIHTLNFLRDIIFTANYQEHKACTDSRENFVKLFEEEFSQYKDLPAAKIQLSSTNPNENGVSVLEDDHQITLTNPNNQRELSLNNRQLVYRSSGQGYKNSEYFNHIVAKAITHLNKTGISVIRNMSLRKVNVIRFETKLPENPNIAIYNAYSKAISPKLNPKFEDFGNVAQSLKNDSNTIVLLENDFELTIKHGYQIDSYNKAEGSSTGLIFIDLEIKILSDRKTEGFEQILEKCHSELYNAFHWTISDHLRSILN